MWFFGPGDPVSAIHPHDQLGHLELQNPSRNLPPRLLGLLIQLSHNHQRKLPGLGNLIQPLPDAPGLQPRLIEAHLDLLNQQQLPGLQTKQGHAALLGPAHLGPLLLAIILIALVDDQRRLPQRQVPGLSINSATRLQQGRVAASRARHVGAAQGQAEGFIRVTVGLGGIAPDGIANLARQSEERRRSLAGDGIILQRRGQGEMLRWGIH